MNELKVVSIRLVDDPPLLSEKQLEGPSEACELAAEEMRKFDRELFCVLNLNARGQPINLNVVSVGTLKAAMIHPREVFKSAILANASYMILLHNHPSGMPSPSREDIATTERLVKCGELLGIEVSDHLIIGKHQNYSLRENDMMPQDNSKTYTSLVAEEERNTFRDHGKGQASGKKEKPAHKKKKHRSR